MARQLYLETGSDGGALLYSFDPPGLVARGASLSEAISAVPTGFAELLDIRRAAEATAMEVRAPQPGAEEPVSATEFSIAERYVRRGVVANGMTTATFTPDLVPMTRAEVEEAIALLAESRRRLVSLRPAIEASAGTGEVLGHRSTPARWTIGEQLRHIASAERWYIAKIVKGLPRLPRHDCPWERLTAVRVLVVGALRRLSGAELALQTRDTGEMWTARKVVRRLMYHEKFHRDTIRRDFRHFLGTSGNGGGGS